jgi:hypothetical protein
MVTAAAIYCLAVGALMFVWWGVDIRAGALRRPDRSHAEITLHLTAELLTAAVLVLGGSIRLSGGTISVALLGLGMLLYTIIQSPGYFVARREIMPVVLFACLFILTVTATAATLTA